MAHCLSALHAALLAVSSLKHSARKLMTAHDKLEKLLMEIRYQRNTCHPSSLKDPTSALSRLYNECDKLIDAILQQEQKIYGKKNSRKKIR